MKRTIFQKSILLIAIGFIWNAHSLQSETPQNNEPISSSENIDRLLKESTLDHALLEKTIIYYTNKIRMEHGLKPCLFFPKLRDVARSHSREMAQLNYFSHQSPVEANQELSNRMENAGINIKPIPGETIVMGENIATDYFLKIDKIPYYIEERNGKSYYIDARTDQPIINQTYREFARHTMTNWMDSPGHRKNLLNDEFDRIGIGVWIGKLNNMPAIYVTQNFMGNF